MSAKHLLTPVALFTLFTLTAVPALAQDPQGERPERRRGPAFGQDRPRDEGRADNGRGDGGRGRYAVPRDRGGDGDRGWRDGRGRADDGGRDNGGPRAGRGDEGRGRRDDGGRNNGGTWAGRGDEGRRADDGRRGSGWGDRGGYDRGGYDRRDGRGGWGDYRYRRDDRRVVVVPPRYGYRSGWGYGSRGYRPYYPPTFRSWIRPDYYYHRPYYSFRPRVSIGFGLWIGHPVSLPSWGYAPFPVYGYPSGGYVTVSPSRAAYGAVSFEITPFEADLYVDGTLVGRVGDFTPNRPPLTLSPGTHQVEVVAEGYEPLTFEVHVTPGLVTPYRGDLRPW